MLELALEVSEAAQASDQQVVDSLQAVIHREVASLQAALTSAQPHRTQPRRTAPPTNKLVILGHLSLSLSLKSCPQQP